MKPHWLTIELGKMPKTQLLQSDREDLLPNYLPQTQFPGSTGHFDWLRSTSGEILGVRYWPFDDAVHAVPVNRLLMQCGSLKYAVLDSANRFVSIFFKCSVAEVAEKISNDQDLGENGIYQNEQGLMALCFEVDASVLERMPRSIFARSIGCDE